MSANDHNELDEPRRKVAKTHNIKAVFMNSQLKSPDFTSFLADTFLSKSTRTDDHTKAEVCTTPFRHVSLQNFITDQDYIEQLISELKGLELQDKNNDLYKFKQSMDLKHVGSTCVTRLRDVLQDQMLPWLRDVTKFPLNDKVDMFCSNYDYTDTLLCHDDELEERHIAYIYYLVPDSWSKEDGGTLDLFKADEKGQPGELVKSVVPAKNQFLFFEVSHESFHQVSEVLSTEKTRLAVSGWFHGPPIRRPAPYIEPPMPIAPCGGIEEHVFLDWINPVYISQEIQNDIRERFESESELELSDFLKDEKYDELLAVLQSEERVWTHRGPPNKRSYDVCTPDNLPSAARTFMQILRSDAMFLLLSSMTGLQLHDSPTLDGDGVANGSDARNDIAKCRVEAQRFRHGDYTLLHDTDAHVGEMALDVVFFVGGAEWSMKNGGYISYVAKGEDEELLSVCPSPNSMALIYKDRETLRFVKHLNHRVTKAKESQYFTISATYYESTD